MKIPYNSFNIKEKWHKRKERRKESNKERKKDYNKNKTTLSNLRGSKKEDRNRIKELKERIQKEQIRNDDDKRNNIHDKDLIYKAKQREYYLRRKNPR